MYTLNELRTALDRVNEILTDLEQQELNLNSEKSEVITTEIIQNKEEFERLYIECMERLCAGETEPHNEVDTFAKLQALKPEDYEVDDFFGMLMKLKNIKNSCIYLIWYRRLILDKKPLVISMRGWNGWNGPSFVGDFFDGIWITPEEKMTEEFMARFEMVLETVRFEEYDKLSYDFLYGYEERILNFNSFDMLVKAIRSGLLLEYKKEIYIDYCLTKEQTELVPYLMSNTLWRW